MKEPLKRSIGEASKGRDGTEGKLKKKIKKKGKRSCKEKRRKEEEKYFANLETVAGKEKIWVILQRKEKQGTLRESQVKRKRIYSFNTQSRISNRLKRVTCAVLEISFIFFPFIYLSFSSSQIRNENKFKLNSERNAYLLFTKMRK